MGRALVGCFAEAESTREVSADGAGRDCVCEVVAIGRSRGFCYQTSRLCWTFQ